MIKPVAWEASNRAAKAGHIERHIEDGLTMRASVGALAGRGRPGPMPDQDTARGRHAAAREDLLRQFARIPAGAPVRLAKRTSNLFRSRARTTVPGLDVGGLDAVLAVDAGARTADVQGMTTYEHLVDATLPYGLMPTVVPQLKTITLGGAVSGLGIESSSFRNGLPHEAVRELEVLTGAGEIVLARPDGPHADLFRAFPNSYGTLGYALRLLIELEPVRPFVRLRHLRFGEIGRAGRRGGRDRRRPGSTTGSRSTSSTARSSPRTRPT